MHAEIRSHHRVRDLYLTFVALMILLATTIAFSYVDLGSAQAAVGLGIAVTKAFLVMLVFMNLRRATSTVRLASAVSIIWLSMFVTLVITDYASRGWHETQPRTLQEANHYTSYDRVSHSAAPLSDISQRDEAISRPARQ